MPYATVKLKNHDAAGEWVTIHGRHVLVEDGQTPEQALMASLRKKTAMTGDKKLQDLKDAKVAELGRLAEKWKKDGTPAEQQRRERAAVESAFESKSKELVKEHADMTMTRAEWMAKCRKDHPDMKPAEMKAWVDKMMKADSSEDAKDKGADEGSEQYAAYANDIKGVEIFSTGTHNGDVYSESDLDQMVAAHAALDYRPAVKIGHTKDAPGAPAYGWVQNLRRVGQKLVADFTDMHDSVVEAVRKRSYDRVSSEVYFNLSRNGKTFGRALKAVALLGAEVPAVAGLTPLHKMEFAAAGEYEKFTAHEAALDVAPQAIFDCLSERMSGLIRQFSNEDDTMKTKAQELQETLEALTVKLNAIGQDGSDDKAKTAEIKKLSEDIAKVSGEIKTLTQADTAEREALAATIKANETRIAELEADGRRRSVAEKVATVKVPAFRAGMEGMYAYALTHSAEKVKIYSKDKDGKEVAADQTLVDIVDSFTAQINAQAEKLFKAYTLNPQNREEGDLSDPGENAGAILDRKTKAYMLAHPEVKDYIAAMQSVKTADPELARQYADQASANASAH